MIIFYIHSSKTHVFVLYVVIYITAYFTNNC